jgi:hypothetical protein
VEEVFGELGQLAGAEERLRVDHVGRQDFGVAVLAGVQVEHEVGEGAFEARSLAEVDDEARAGDLGGALEVEDAEASPISQWGRAGKSKVGLQRVAPGFSTTLSCSDLPMGTESCGRLGSDVAGVELRSPVIAASGTFGYGVEFEEIVSLDRIGAFVTKGLSREPMAGNPTPRIVETAAGMMNAIGLQNMGVKAFVAEKMPKLRKMPGAVVIANIFGFTIEDCVEVIQVLNDAPGIAMYELNASCPNTSHGGMVFGTTRSCCTTW